MRTLSIRILLLALTTISITVCILLMIIGLFSAAKIADSTSSIVQASEVQDVIEKTGHNLSTFLYRQGNILELSDLQSIKGIMPFSEIEKNYLNNVGFLEKISRDDLKLRPLVKSLNTLFLEFSKSDDQLLESTEALIIERNKLAFLIKKFNGQLQTQEISTEATLGKLAFNKTRIVRRIKKILKNGNIVEQPKKINQLINQVSNLTLSGDVLANSLIIKINLNTHKLASLTRKVLSSDQMDEIISVKSNIAKQVIDNTFAHLKKLSLLVKENKKFTKLSAELSEQYSKLSKTSFDENNSIYSSRINIIKQQTHLENASIYSRKSIKLLNDIRSKISQEILTSRNNLKNTTAMVEKNTSYFLLGLGVFVILILLFVSSLIINMINAPLSKLYCAFSNIAEGENDFAVRLDENGIKEISRISQKFNLFADKMQKSSKIQAQILTQNTRIKQALDNISSNMLVIDESNNIIYCNQAMENFLKIAEIDIQKTNTLFNAQKVIGQLKLQELIFSNEEKIIELTQSAKNSTVDIKLGGLSLSLIANPVLNDLEERIGTVIEWNDRTLELSIEEEVQFVVDKALEGDLSNRISVLDKSGFFSNLSNSVNQLVSVSEHVITDTLRVMEKLSTGDLSQKIETDYLGMFDQLKHNVNATGDKLIEVVSGIQQSANSVKTGSSEISRANLELSKRTEEQSASLQQTIISIAAINDNMQQNSQLSIQASEVVENAHVSAIKGGGIVTLAMQAMIEIEQSSKKIADVIDVINTIAFQINLLALNAAVEAARVGEAGRGFTVVASEVRKLAGISAESAKEISVSIKDSSLKVTEGMRLAFKSEKGLTEIVASVNEAAEFVKKIATLNAEQSLSVSKINTSIKYIDDITIQNSAMVEEASKASDHLGQQAHELETMTNFFSKEK